MMASTNRQRQALLTERLPDTNRTVPPQPRSCPETSAHQPAATWRQFLPACSSSSALRSSFEPKIISSGWTTSPRVDQFTPLLGDCCSGRCYLCFYRVEVKASTLLHRRELDRRPGEFLHLLL